MKKKYYLFIVLATGIFFFTAYYFGKSETPKIAQPNNQVETKQTTHVVAQSTNDTDIRAEQTTNNADIPATWKTYSSDRLGVTFQYPDTWTKQGEELNAINRTGNVISIMVNFIDTVTQTTLLIEYHLAPNGTELYKYAQTQFNSSQGLYEKDGKQIMVAGNKAIEGNKTLSIDGKGNPINPPLRLLVVDFLDKQQTGEIELQFKTPLQSSDSEIVKFNQLLSTIKFIN